MTMSMAVREHTCDLFGTRMRLLFSSAMSSGSATHLTTARLRHRLQAIHRALTSCGPSRELDHLSGHAIDPGAA